MPVTYRFGLHRGARPWPRLESDNGIVRLVGLDKVSGGVADFADPGSEQDALAEYLEAMFPTTSPYNEAETDPADDLRIQNLSVRSDTVIP